ncbi:phage tail assembly chaperone, partial [Acinetobacter baumannii]
MGVELEVAGKAYSIGKMSAKKQFHVSRRIAPLIPKLIPVFTRVKSGGGISADLDGLAEVLQPFAD